MTSLTQINSDSQPPKLETFTVVDKDGKIWGAFATQAAAKQYIQHQQNNGYLVDPEIILVTLGDDTKEDLSEDIVNVPLRVTPIAVTKSIPANVQAVYDAHNGAERDRDLQPSGQSVIELAGRTCYAAYGRKNEKTDSHEGYIGNMISQAHWSVAEHASVTFHIQGISRAETHELVRHRHLSFSQESQRYVVVQRPYRVALHPTLLKAYDKEDLLDTLICDFEYVETLYNELREKGYNRKQASEAARAFLPNAAATEITVTGNLRSWVEFVSKRDSDAADAGIRKLAQAIGDQLSVMFPEVFGEDARPIWDETCEQKGHTYGD